MSAFRVSGDCWVHFAFDAAAAIDLEQAEVTLRSSTPTPGATTSRESISDGRRTPPSIQFRPKPLRVVQPEKALSFGKNGSLTEPEVQLTLFDFGAVSVAYRIRFADVALESLRSLSAQMAATTELAKHARTSVERVIRELGSVARRSSVAETVEDYIVFHVEQWTNSEVGAAPVDLVRDGAELAAILRSAEEPLSDGEIADALVCSIAYGRRDLAIIDWSAAIIFEPDRASAADLLAVLEFANVELVEMRFLDDRLDAVLDHSYRENLPGNDGAVSGWSRSSRRARQRLASLHMDSALLFEGVNNAIKLIGDQYLARVYRLAARRFHLAEWDAAILRKIETLQRLYEKTADEQSTRRMEVLEWIIIILIALSIVVMFIPGLK